MSLPNRAKLCYRFAGRFLPPSQQERLIPSYCTTRHATSSIRSFATTTTTTTTVAAPRVVTHQPHQRSNSKNRHGWTQTKQEILHFLHQIDHPAYPVGMISIQAKRILTQMVNLPRHVEKGPLAARLLQASNQDLDASDNSNKEVHKQSMRSKLYQLTIEAWLSTPKGRARDKAWDEAERLLWEVLNSANENEKQTNKDHQFFTDNLPQNVPNINGAFALVVFNFCKGHGHHNLSKQTADRLRPLVETIQQLWDDKKVKLVASSSAMDAILYYHFKLQQAGEADRILQSILRTTKNESVFLKPTLHGMNTVISTHAKVGNVQRAKEIVDKMLAAKSTKEGKEMYLPLPNVVTFNGLIDAIHQRGGREAGVLAEEVLHWMESLSIHPTTVSFTTVISAWAKSHHPDAAERAEAILRHSIDLQVAGSRSDVAPNEVTFGSVISVWSRSGRPDAAERAVGVVELMKKLYEEGGLPQKNLTNVFNMLIVTLGRSKSQEAWDKVTEFLQYMDKAGIPLDTTTHNSVMVALIKVREEGPRRALDYFIDLEAKFLSGDSGIQLDVYSYNVALDALSKCSRDSREGAPAQALDLLQRMMDRKDLEPTTPTFNTVMKILAKSSMDDAALRCEHLLEEMEGPGGVKPSGVSFSVCISAWGYTRTPERYDRMRQLLSRMEAAYEAGNEDAKPNAVPYNMVLIGCCCGSSEEQERALHCVLETLAHLRRVPGLRPNQNTYPLVLRSIGLATAPGERRDSLLLTELEHCVKDGLVCRQVSGEIARFSPNLVIEYANAQGGITMDRIPHEWRRNTGTS